MNYIGTYLIYGEGELSAEEIVERTKDALAALEIEAVDCYGEKKNNLILKSVGGPEEHKIRKAARRILKRTIEELKKEKGLSSRGLGDPENKKEVEKLLKKVSRKMEGEE